MVKVAVFSQDNAVPLEMHKVGCDPCTAGSTTPRLWRTSNWPAHKILQVRIVQKLNLKPLEERIAAMEGAGYNTFLLQNADVFLGGCRGGSPHNWFATPPFPFSSFVYECNAVQIC